MIDRLRRLWRLAGEIQQAAKTLPAPMPRVQTVSPIQVEIERDASMRATRYEVGFYVADRALREAQLTEEDFTQWLKHAVGERLEYREPTTPHLANEVAISLEERLSQPLVSPENYPGGRDAWYREAGSQRWRDIVYGPRQPDDNARVQASEGSGRVNLPVSSGRTAAEILRNDTIPGPTSNPAPEPPPLAQLDDGPHSIHGLPNASTHHGGINIDNLNSPDQIDHDLAALQPKLVFRGPARAQRPSDCLSIGPLGSRNDWLTVTFQEPEDIITTGCFTGTLAQFEEEVGHDGDGSPRKRDYMLALQFVRLLSELRQGQRQRAREDRDRAGGQVHTLAEFGALVDLPGPSILLTEPEPEPVPDGSTATEADENGQHVGSPFPYSVNYGGRRYVLSGRTVGTSEHVVTDGPVFREPTEHN